MWMGKFDLNMLRVDVKRGFKDIRIRLDVRGTQSSDKEFGRVTFSDRASLHSFLNYSGILI